MVRPVEVGPRDESTEVVGAELNAVVTFTQHLTKFSGGEMKFHRREQMVVAFDAVIADEGKQIGVAGGEPATVATSTGKIRMPAFERNAAAQIGLGLGVVVA